MALLGEHLAAVEPEKLLVVLEGVHLAGVHLAGVGLQEELLPAPLMAGRIAEPDSLAHQDLKKRKKIRNIII